MKSVWVLSHPWSPSPNSNFWKNKKHMSDVSASSSITAWWLFDKGSSASNFHHTSESFLSWSSMNEKIRVKFYKPQNQQFKAFQTSFSLHLNKYCFVSPEQIWLRFIGIWEWVSPASRIGNSGGVPQVRRTNMQVNSTFRLRQTHQIRRKNNVLWNNGSEEGITAAAMRRLSHTGLVLVVHVKEQRTNAHSRSFTFPSSRTEYVREKRSHPFSILRILHHKAHPRGDIRKAWCNA